jgi:hypothetical protein
MTFPACDQRHVSESDLGECRRTERILSYLLVSITWASIMSLYPVRLDNPLDARLSSYLIATMLSVRAFSSVVSRQRMKRVGGER